MYLIGFFASPLPYLVLVGIYMSGFAYFNWKSGAASADVPDHDAVEVHEEAFVPVEPASGLLVVSADAFTGIPPGAGMPDMLPPASRPLFAPLEASPLSPAPLCQRVCTLFVPSGHAIRPPPLS
jgi:hypothetical protein